MGVHEASIPATPSYPGLVKESRPVLDLHECLEAFRKEQGLTQLAPAELVEMHISTIRRDKYRPSQSAMDAIRKPATARNASAYRLLFAQDESGPGDERKLQFQATSRFNSDETNVIRSVIETIVMRNTIRAAERRFTGADSGGTTR